MCLATLCVRKGEGEVVTVMTKVQKVKIDGDKLHCESLFGETLELDATVETIDLASAVIVARRPT